MTLRPDYVPHDPDHAGGCHAHEGSVCRCPLCGTEWPCPERLRQRKIVKQVVAFLKSDLYERAELLADDPRSGMRWTSPIGWSVFIGYGVDGAWAVINDPAGDVHTNTIALSVEWLERALP